MIKLLEHIVHSTALPISVSSQRSNTAPFNAATLQRIIITKVFISRTQKSSKPAGQQQLD